MAEALPPDVPQSRHLEVSISCTDLVKSSSWFNDASSYVIVQEYDDNVDQWNEIFRTETINKDLNPHFANKIDLDYDASKEQRLKFLVISGKKNVVGETKATLKEIIHKKNLTLNLMQIGTPNSTGNILLSAQLISDCQFITLQLEGKSLDKKDWFGKSDPFLELYKQTSIGKWKLVYRTEVHKNTLNPRWKNIVLNLQSLCDGNIAKPIKVVCADWNRNGRSNPIGECVVTVMQLNQAKLNNTVMFDLVLPGNVKNSNYKNSGQLVVVLCTICRQYTFLDYIRGGCKLQFSMAIDFTASNKPPSQLDSLHHTGFNDANQYLMVIRAVGGTLQYYDADKQFPAYGFGAQLPSEEKASQDFPLTLNANNPNCDGVQALIKAYKSCLTKVKLSEPANLAPVINRVATAAKRIKFQSKMAHEYHILFIITDGEVKDMPATREAIVQASKLPLSIVLVGVGSNDFRDLVELDSDDTILTAPSGENAFRDIVQFVPYLDFARDPVEKFLEQVMEEIPHQVEQYFHQMDLQPPNMTSP
ncbi:unnamed protein product [Lampetra planeri]